MMRASLFPHFFYWVFFLISHIFTMILPSSTTVVAMLVAFNLCLGSSASIVPSPLEISNVSFQGRQLASPFDTSSSGCAVSTAMVPNQRGELVHPTYNVTQIGLGIGTQNYSCSSTGNYTSVGAVAELYDVSCEYLTADLSNVSAEAYRLWVAAPTYYTESTLIDVLHAYRGTPSVPTILGQHYFVPNPTGSGLSPKWDFTSESFAGNNAAYVIGRAVGDIPSPDGSANIDWLYLTNVQGGLAQEVYRTNTTGGQPPTEASGSFKRRAQGADEGTLNGIECTPGSTVAVKYTSLYCKFCSLKYHPLLT
ncbi:uncharacterized protein C8R40DRAFT_1090532 [Lentinula edodes]|uniref:uncharacterized protein n=1 Tax=Lentinula edodes TaxID=5353 RepID=UPI001E8DAFEE|nr:uncharacterized protein C8R40DRAFT_1090532 [Lentinula edodes]KAH7878649.1 hypothetical protein C8R40DRAFT_1090532 [Lentinula edodes]